MTASEEVAAREDRAGELRRKLTGPPARRPRTAAEVNAEKARLEMIGECRTWATECAPSPVCHGLDDNVIHYRIIDTSGSAGSGLTCGSGRVVFDRPISDPAAEIIRVKSSPVS